MGKQKTWYLLMAAAALICLIYIGMVSPHVRLSGGMPIDAERFPNLRIGENVPPVMPYTLEWGAFDIAGGVICLFLGLVCFALGLIRAANKLRCGHILLMGLFASLFALNTLSMTGPASRVLSLELLFYVNKLSFYGYPIALFLHFYLYLSPRAKKWLLAPIIILAAYGAAAWLMFFALGLPLDIPDRLYSPIAGVCAFLFLPAGSLWPESKDAARYMRTLTAVWAVFWLYLLVRTLAGSPFLFHDEYKNAILLSAAYMMCHVLLINTRELVGHQSEIRMLEVKNEFLMENYQTLENYIAQIAHMRHELHHHLLAISILLEKGQYERLSNYLSGLNESYGDLEGPVYCGNRIIQALFTHAARRARQLEFEIEFDVSPLPPLDVPDADLVSLFMNMLSNALESCANIQDPEGRWAKVQLNASKPYMYLSVTNARHGDVGMDGGRYVTTKGDRLLHGYGIGIIRKIAEKHGGFVSFEHTGDSFSAEAALKIEW